MQIKVLNIVLEKYIHRITILQLQPKKILLSSESWFIQSLSPQKQT